MRLTGEYDLIVEPDYDEQFMTVWIDYDDNMFFDEDEVLVSDIYIYWVTTTNISIPIDAPLGLHLLRLKACCDAIII